MESTATSYSFGSTKVAYRVLIRMMCDAYVLMGVDTWNDNRSHYRVIRYCGCFFVFDGSCFHYKRGAISWNLNMKILMVVCLL